MNRTEGYLVVLRLYFSMFDYTPMNKVYSISLISGCAAFHVHAINLLCTLLSGDDISLNFPFVRVKKD